MNNGDASLLSVNFSSPLCIPVLLEVENVRVTEAAV
jgi:hypothetical protein